MIISKSWRSATFHPADNGEDTGGASGSQTGEDAGAGDRTEGAQQYENDAKEMGWVPQDQFQGDPEKWIDAKEFVDRGTHILPILQANNRRLRSDLLTRDQELVRLRESQKAMEKSLKVVQDHYAQSVKEEVEAAKRDLRKQLIAAREIGDVETELDVQDKLDELKNKKEESVPNNIEISKPELDPVFTSWQKENSWFGDTNNIDNNIKTLEVLKIGEELRKQNSPLTGRAFMDRCMQLYETRQNPVRAKVEGGGNGASPGSKGREFLSLPAEAKQACHADTYKFVGPGKMFKTEREWEDHWTNLYLAQG